MNKLQYLQTNQLVIQDKIVLDLACHDGESTSVIQSLGAKHVYAVDIREHLVQQAQQKVFGNVDFYVGDITDSTLVDPLVTKSQSVILLGVFYHLFDHFRFLSSILKPNLEHCLIETVCGPESLNPEMFWGFENTTNRRNGKFGNLDRIPHGTPNTAWIVECAKIFGFELDWIHYYGKHTNKTITNITVEEYTNVAGPDWPPYHDLVLGKVPDFVAEELQTMLCDYTDRRMILRFYNKHTVQSTPLSLGSIYQWPY